MPIIILLIIAFLISGCGDSEKERREAEIERELQEARESCERRNPSASLEQIMICAVGILQDNTDAELRASARERLPKNMTPAEKRVCEIGIFLGFSFRLGDRSFYEVTYDQLEYVRDSGVSKRLFKDCQIIGANSENIVIRY